MYKECLGQRIYLFNLFFENINISKLEIQILVTMIEKNDSKLKERKAQTVLSAHSNIMKNFHHKVSHTVSHFSLQS